jgi:hypothetical protein
MAQRFYWAPFALWSSQKRFGRCKRLHPVVAFRSWRTLREVGRYRALEFVQVFGYPLFRGISGLSANNFLLQNFHFSLYVVKGFGALGGV